MCVRKEVREMSKCVRCRDTIPHYFLRVIPLPNLKVDSLENMKEFASIKSRFYVGSGHGEIAEDHGAVCCGCDSGTEDLVFCRCTKSNNYNNYEKYSNHCFWKIVPSSLHKLGRKEGGD